MPTITRWFRVTHDINSDPEIWELREKFGDRAGFVWLECLSIADRNNGKLGPNSPQLHAILASKCRVYSPKVRAIFAWCFGKGWLVDRGDLYIAKWAKYNNRRETAKLPSETRPLQTSPSETSNDQDPATPAPSADPPKRKELDPKIKAVADRIYKSDPFKFQRLIQWIKQAEKYHYPAPVIAETLERFEARAGDVTNWYAYLDTMILKVRGDYNRDQSVSEHERHKAELREVVKRA